MLNRAGRSQRLRLQVRGAELHLARAGIAGGRDWRLERSLERSDRRRIRRCKTAVTIALGLIGVMALWLGVMRLAERAGLVQKLARALRPIMRRLFPDVPAEHPAMGAMLMNMAANMLGLGNAATPLGLRAMRDLESLNPHPGAATNAMCTFLAINTASVQLIPTTAIAILVAAGSTRPTAIVGTALLATLCAATTAIIAVKTLEKLPWFARPVAAVAGRGSRENAAATNDLNSKSDRRKSFEQ